MEENISYVSCPFTNDSYVILDLVYVLSLCCTTSIACHRGPLSNLWKVHLSAKPSIFTGGC